MSPQEYAEAFEREAYDTYLKTRIAEAGVPIIGAMNRTDFVEDMRANCPLDEWFFVQSAATPTKRSLEDYNDIIAMTSVGKALGMEEQD